MAARIVIVMKFVHNGIGVSTVPYNYSHDLNNNSIPKALRKTPEYLSWKEVRLGNIRQRMYSYVDGNKYTDIRYAARRRRGLATYWQNLKPM